MFPPNRFNGIDDLKRIILPNSKLGDCVGTQSVLILKHVCFISNTGFRVQRTDWVWPFASHIRRPGRAAKIKNGAL